jgi:hypothetical protein
MLTLIYKDNNLCWAVGPFLFNRSVTGVYSKLASMHTSLLLKTSKHETILTTELTFINDQDMEINDILVLNLNLGYVLQYATLLHMLCYAISLLLPPPLA